MYSYYFEDIMQLKNSYYYFKSALTPEQCQKIIELGESKMQDEIAKGNSVEAGTYGDEQKSAKPADAIPLNETPKSLMDVPIENTYVRDSQVSWLSEPWLYDLITPYIKTANQQAGWWWDYDYHEMMQFTKYNSPGGFYGWHKDGDSDKFGAYKRYLHGITETPLTKSGHPPFGYTENENMVGKVRKISMTINLNAPGDYEGGNLKFDFGMHSNRDSRFHECEEIRPQGSIIVFPSFIDHCVTPVTKGTRYSLVLWTVGAPWK